VAEVYQQHRRRLLSRRPRQLGEKSLALARFVAEADPELKWRDRLNAWNAAYPVWAYTPENVRNFYRDAVAAQQRLLAGRAIVPPDGRASSVRA
jgi:hypothetical protein